MTSPLVLFAGSSNRNLADKISKRLGLPLGQNFLGKFASGETRVEINESVRDRDVFVVQSGYGPSGVVSDYLMEVLIMVQACKMGSARRVTVVVPAFPYAVEAGQLFEKPMEPPRNAWQAELLNDFQKRNRERQDSLRAICSHDAVHDSQSRSNALKKCNNTYKLWTARSGTLIAKSYECAGTDLVITLDLHHAQYQGFFDIPVDNLPSLPLFVKYIRGRWREYAEGAVVVSPDAGGAKRAVALATALDLPFAMLHQEKLINSDDGDGDGVILVGDVRNHNVILIDDLADTCTTLSQAATTLMQHGANRVCAFLTHGIFSDTALSLINESPLQEVFVTDSIDQKENLKRCEKLRVISVAGYLAECIRRIHNGESVSALFVDHHD